MNSGTVCDIRELTLHDGPGLRTTVFLKGCPLRCSWCHNPEAQRSEPQTIEAAGQRRVVGTRYEPAALAALLNRQAPVLREIGGVTFSGGEPLQQGEFLREVIEQLSGLHIVLDTSGNADRTALDRVAARCDLVHYDLKLIDPAMHRRYTGCDNALILANLRHLSEMGIPYVVRVPLIPGVTDTRENLAAIARTVRGLPGLLRVDLLPYNRAAGGKYASLGMSFEPGFDESAEVHIETRPFIEAHIDVHVAGPAGDRTDTGSRDKELR
jgi:pyruvate formate lyase activating enzyme